MKSLIKTCILLLLLFNAIGAIYGGYQLMHYPDGSSMGLSLALLRFSGFNNYFIPGIILFIFNGLYGVFVSAATIFNFKYTSLLVIGQGAILTGWIVIQLILIKTFSPFHVILGCTGILLMILGWLLTHPIRHYPINSVL